MPSAFPFDPTANILLCIFKIASPISVNVLARVDLQKIKRQNQVPFRKKEILYLGLVEFQTRLGLHFLSLYYIIYIILFNLPQNVFSLNCQ